MSVAAAPSGYGEFRKGWPVLLAATLGVTLGAAPIPFYTIGLFAPELAKSFHWGFGQIQLGILVSSVTTLVTVPLVGIVADRIGVRATALTSLVLFGLSFMGFALSTGSLVQFYGNWALNGLLGAGTLPITWTRAVNHRFEVRKGLALGVCLAGTGVFGIIGKPLVAWWIAELGWRGAYVAVGLLPIVIALPVGLAFFRDTPPEPRVGETGETETVEGFTLGQALGDWRFWLMGVALVTTAFAVGGPTPNMENILAQHGFSMARAATLTPLIGASVIVGRLASGWLMDRVWAPLVAFVLLTLPAVACLMLAHGQLSYAAAATAIALIGLAAGMESDLVAYLVARYFGLRKYSSIYGSIYVFYALGGALAASVFGWAYDQTHSYASVLTVSAAILVAGGATFLTLGRYRFAHRRQR
jgi:MFS family permease